MSNPQITQATQSAASASGAGEVLLTTLPTQQLGFGNIAYDPSGLTQEQLLCAASADKPLPATQDAIVEVLKTCGVTSVWERETQGQIPQNTSRYTTMPFSDPQPTVCGQGNTMLIVGGVSLATLVLMMYLNKNKGAQF